MQVSSETECVGVVWVELATTSNILVVAIHQWKTNVD